MVLLLFLFSMLCHIELICLVNSFVLDEPLLNDVDLSLSDVGVIGLKKVFKIDLTLIFDIKVME